MTNRSDDNLVSVTVYTGTAPVGFKGPMASDAVTHSIRPVAAPAPALDLTKLAKVRADAARTAKLCGF